MNKTPAARRSVDRRATRGATLPAVDRLADVPDDVCLALKDARAEAGYDDELIMSRAGSGP